MREISERNQGQKSGTEIDVVGCDDVTNIIELFCLLQRHHFGQALCILNADGCNIFQNLSHVVS